MENLFKQLEVWVTRLKLKIRRDEFFVTRIRLTAIYTILAVVFLLAFSVVLYEGLMTRLSESALETIADPGIRGLVISKAGGIIRDLILLGDMAVLFIVISVGFYLTRKTLDPIKKMVKKQERFIADASHELRTPLSVMKTGVEVALRQKNLSPDNAQKTLSDVLEEVNILTLLANDLINISKYDFDSIKLSRIYLPDILEKTVKRLRPIAEEKKIELLFSGSGKKDKYVMGSEAMVGQIFYNLIYNAIIYTPESGSVKVGYTVKSNKYLVSISDTGMGISKENLDHIFEPFFRAENSRTTPGSGLGLSIVKSHIDLHLGSIDIQSEVGKGTVVLVGLPIES